MGLPVFCRSVSRTTYVRAVTSLRSARHQQLVVRMQVGFANGRLRIFNTGAAVLVAEPAAQTLRQHGGAIQDIAFDAAGARLYTAGAAPAICSPAATGVKQPAPRETYVEIPVKSALLPAQSRPSSAYNLSSLPLRLFTREHHAVMSGADGRICVLDTQQGYLPVAYLATHCTDGACLAISSDGGLLAAAACSPETRKVLAAVVRVHAAVTLCDVMQMRTSTCKCWCNASWY